MSATDRVGVTKGDGCEGILCASMIRDLDLFAPNRPEWPLEEAEMVIVRVSHKPQWEDNKIKQVFLH